MANVNMNLSDKQIHVLERCLDRDYLYWEKLADHIELRTYHALIRLGIIEESEFRHCVLTPYGIQSYCATILTKYEGATHERIHSALNNYQRLFVKGNITTITDM